MLGKACGEHIGKHARHIRRSQHVVQSLESFGEHQAIHVIKEIVNILHCQLKILQTEIERERGVLIKRAGERLASFDGHVLCVVAAESKFGKSGFPCGLEILRVDSIFAR